MSKTASLVVRAVVDGKRTNLSPKQAKQLGVKGTYYLRMWEGGKEKWQSLGSDPSVARVAVIRKEREFWRTWRQQGCVEWLTLLWKMGVLRRESTL